MESQHTQPAEPEAMPHSQQTPLDLGIATMFAEMDKRVESHVNEEMNSFRNDLNRLSSSVQQVQERQKAESQRASSSTPDASTAALQAIKEEIRRGGRAIEHSQTMQNLKAELNILRLLSTDAHERKDFKEATLAFGRYIHQREEGLERKMERMEEQMKNVTAEKVAMKFTMEQLITAIRELLEIAKNWLPEDEVQKVKEKVKKLDP